MLAPSHELQHLSNPSNAPEKTSPSVSQTQHPPNGSVFGFDPGLIFRRGLVPIDLCLPVASPHRPDGSAGPWGIGTELQGPVRFPNARDKTSVTWLP